MARGVSVGLESGEGRGEEVEALGLAFSSGVVVVKSLRFVAFNASTLTFMPRIDSLDLYLPDAFAVCPVVPKTPRSLAEPRDSIHLFCNMSSLNPFPNSDYLPPHLLSPHQNLTKLSPPILSPLFNSVAISTLNGLSTSGYTSNWCIASNVDVSVYAGDHDVFKRSRQISPVLKSTFGWQMGVVKVILGGASGYEGGMRMSRRQRPARVESASVVELVNGLGEGKYGYRGWVVGREMPS